MRSLLQVAFFLAATTVAHAQFSATGNGSIDGNTNGNFSGNGNTNSNLNGNLNGNNNGNLNGNVTSASASIKKPLARNNVSIQDRLQAPSVFAPGLAAAGIESCLGSASVGGSGAGFGVTVGGTWSDRPCNLRLYSRTLYAMGHRVAATQILCNDPDVAQALGLEGVDCFNSPRARTVAAVAPAAVAYAPAPSARSCLHYDFFRGCLDNGGLSARAESVAVAEAPAAPTPIPVAAQRAAPPSRANRRGCLNYDLFAGCRDQAGPAQAASVEVAEAHAPAAAEPPPASTGGACSHYELLGGCRDGDN